jgi:hypothetical protein
VGGGYRLPYPPKTMDNAAPTATVNEETLS